GIAFTLASLVAYPGWRCGLSWFFASLSLMFSAGMFFCMALNLPLVIAHNVNGQSMEKYYVLGTTLVSFICNLVPYASGKFDARNDTCWYRDTNQTDMLRWLIGTQIFWMMLASAGEVGAFLIIVGYLIAYEVCLSRQLIHRFNMLTTRDSWTWGASTRELGSRQPIRPRPRTTLG
ncbi:hypothetical protein K438DRAFT_1574540, partial [Mycena galopus ATCC 62051]